MDEEQAVEVRLTKGDIHKIKSIREKMTTAYAALVDRLLERMQDGRAIADRELALLLREARECLTAFDAVPTEPFDLGRLNMNDPATVKMLIVAARGAAPAPRTFAHVPQPRALEGDEP